jgi:ProQ/FINO family
MTARKKGHDPNIAAVLDLFADTWPMAFSLYEVRHVPLALGIHNDIFAALGGAVTMDEVRAVLRCCVSNKVYRSRLTSGPRVSALTADPSGVVTPEEIPTKQTPTKKTVPAVSSPPSPSPSPSPSQLASPRRLSIADFRAAAARRREQTNPPSRRSTTDWQIKQRLRKLRNGYDTIQRKHVSKSR